jgi:hypothetical protein
LPVFYESASLMDEGDPKNREHRVQIITTIPEILSTDHSRNQTTDKRIITANDRAEIRKGYLKNNLDLIFIVRI